MVILYIAFGACLVEHGVMNTRRDACIFFPEGVQRSNFETCRATGFILRTSCSEFLFPISPYLLSAPVNGMDTETGDVSQPNERSHPYQSHISTPAVTEPYSILQSTR